MKHTNIKTKINLRLFIPYLGVFLLVLLTTMSSCKKDSDCETDSTVTIGSDGGVFQFSKIEISFPDGSVTEDIIIDGSIVEMLVLPENITPISEIHKIDISNPDAYIANSASMAIDHDYHSEITSIFVSSDGNTWTDLRGVLYEDQIKAQIPHFSYFFAGKVQYEFTFQNDSTTSQNFFLYQYDANVSNSVTLPIVLQSITVYPFTTVSYNLTEDLFFWNSTGELSIGEIVKDEIIVIADQNTHNMVTLIEQNGSYIFQSSTAGPIPGTLTIQSDATIPQSGVLCGIGYGNTPSYVVRAAPNKNFTFNVTSNEFFVGLGDYVTGEFLNVSTLTSVSISFPVETFSTTVKLDDSQNLTVTY